MKEQRQFVYGLKGLSELLSISIDRAYLLTKTGKLDPATVMRGERKRMFDTGKVFEIMTLANLKKEGGKNGE